MISSPYNEFHLIPSGHDYSLSNASTARHYAAVSTAKPSASYQSPVEEKRVAGCSRYVYGGERVLS